MAAEKSKKPPGSSRRHFLSKTIPLLFAAESIFLIYMAFQPGYAIPAFHFPFLRGGDGEHFLAYLAYGFLAYGAFSLKIRDRKALLLSLVWAGFFAGVTEGIQAFVPTRFADPADWVVDVIGAGAGVCISRRGVRSISS